MREIEIKARVENTRELLDKLSAQGIVLSAPIKQRDVVYGARGVKANAPGSIWLRIRTENDTKNIFTLKKQFEGGLDSIEHETEVADASELQAIIEALDFVLFSDLTKHRQKAKIGDIEICLDVVEGLGTFIEAEKLAADDANNSTIVDELWSLSTSLGIERSAEQFAGYDILLKQKQHNIPN